MLKPKPFAILNGAVARTQNRRKTSAELVINDPWLEEFLKDIGGFQESYKVFLKEPIAMSSALLEYVEQVRHELFFEVWDAELRAIEEVLSMTPKKTLETHIRSGTLRKISPIWMRAA